MLLNSALISTFLVASAVLAHRTPKLRLSRYARQAADGYNPNIAGAVLTGEIFDSITGTFTLPSGVTGQSGSAASIYVDIACPDSDVTLLAGVQFETTDRGTIYQALLEWYPDRDSSFADDFTVSADDTIRVSIVTNSTKHGSVNFENLTTGKSSQPISGFTPLCMQKAEWVVQNTGEAALPAFGTVRIEGQATGNGKTYTLDRAAVTDIQQNGQKLTKTWIEGSTVAIEYVSA